MQRLCLLSIPKIRGLYNFYRIAENVGALHKYYYMVRYSMLKTLAGKHRTNVSVIKKRHMVNGVLRIPYDTTKGRKYCEFYHDGFRKHSDGYDNVADVMPSYRKYDSRHTIVNRIKSRSMRDLRGTCRLFMYAPRKNAEIAERQGYI